MDKAERELKALTRRAVKRGERLGAQPDGRVLSEHASVALTRGTKEKLKVKAKEERRSASALVQEGLDNWIFHPRRGVGGATPPTKRKGRRG
jgi:hypothetical protein